MSRFLKYLNLLMLGMVFFNACNHGEEILFSGEGFPDECALGTSPGSEDACPAGDGFAQFCTASNFGNNICLNVCNEATNLGSSNGNAGDFCETDEQCGTGLSCDNDQVGSSSCQCVGSEEPTPAGGDCPTVNVDPGSVPFDGACDADADCADELPCMDCRCV